MKFRGRGCVRTLEVEGYFLCLLNLMEPYPKWKPPEEEASPVAMEEGEKEVEWELYRVLT